MEEFKIWRWGLIAVTLVLLAGCRQDPLLYDVSFSAERITPNADGVDDVLRIEYWLSRSAELSIYFVGSDGERYDFREREPRAPCDEDPYSVYFSGVVAGYVMPGEEPAEFLVTQRVLSDDVYQWVLEADDGEGLVERVTGTLVVEDADMMLPELTDLSVSVPVFTPNRDGIDDRTMISLQLSKQVASLSVYLVGDDGVRYHVAESDESPARGGEPGEHVFDYDAGLSFGAEPPPDGTYVVWAEAQDAVGQHSVISTTLTIQDGGIPQGYILNAEVEWSAQSILLGETLYFTLTVENDSGTAIRTSGPPPGTVYESDVDYVDFQGDQLGVFRVGIHCENATISYPWRWSVGDESVLVDDGVGNLYLPPYTRAVVSGGIRFVDVVSARNPQLCWAALIHEGIEMVAGSTHVDPVFLFVERP